MLRFDIPKSLGYVTVNNDNKQALNTPLSFIIFIKYSQEYSCKNVLDEMSLVFRSRKIVLLIKRPYIKCPWEMVL